MIYNKYIMNWINAFEIMCYIITAIFLADVIRRKDRAELWLFISAALAGFALELLAVRVTGIYHYSTDFYISIGFEPYQFPLFGGLMWGGLTVCALRIAKKPGLSKLKTALISGFLIVTMDILLDVAAIRLNGGFWVWEGREITLDITHHMFMSVIWVNFLGYMFETPAIIFISLLTQERRMKAPIWKQLISSVLIGISGIICVGLASGISLLLNRFTDEWFACIAFILVWAAVLVIIIKGAAKVCRGILPFRQWDFPVIIYWVSMYVFCIAALIHLGIAGDAVIYFACGILFFIGTVFLAVMKVKEGERHDL